jgi:hypothetical protein
MSNGRPLSQAVGIHHHLLEQSLSQKRPKRNQKSLHPSRQLLHVSRSRIMRPVRRQ